MGQEDENEQVVAESTVESVTPHQSNQTAVSARATHNVDSSIDFPDGGWVAWRNVIAGCLAFFIVFGIPNTFGVFATYYETELFPNVNPSSIQWIGGLASSASALFGIIIGRLTDYYGHRFSLYVGAVLHVLSFFLCSISTQLWQFVLVQGLLYGIANAFVFYSTLAVPTQYFLRLRATVMSIVISGSGLGGIVFPALATYLIRTLSLAWTWRIFGFISVAVWPVIFILFKPRWLPLRKTMNASAVALDLSMFKDAMFVALTFALFFGLQGSFPVTYNITTYGRSLGISDEVASALTSVLNASTIIGRIGMGVISDKYLGPIYTMMLILGFNIITILALWLPAKSVAVLFVFVSLAGLTIGGVIAMSGPLVAGLYGARRLPTTLGTVWTFAGIGQISSSPIFGAIQASSGGWTVAIIYVVLVNVVGLVLTILVQYMRNRKSVQH